MTGKGRGYWSVPGEEHRGRPGKRGGSLPRGASTEASAPTTAEPPVAHRDISAGEASAKHLEREIVDNHVREECGLYDADGWPILRKTGEQSQIEFSEDELASFPGAILTHNHPSGNSFSDSDVSLAISRNMAEIRAVGSQYYATGTGTTRPRWRYIFRAPPGTCEAVQAVVFKAFGNTMSSGNDHADGLAMIQSVYNEAHDDVRKDLQAKVNARTISPSEASALHYHKVMQLFVAKIKEYYDVTLDYRREEW